MYPKHDELLAIPGALRPILFTMHSLVNSATQPITMDQRKSLIYDLYLKRQASLHQTELINRDEESRIQKLRLLQAQDDIYLLGVRAAQKEAHVALALAQHNVIKADVEEGKEVIRNQDNKLKKQSIELANLKVRIYSLILGKITFRLGS